MSHRFFYTTRPDQDGSSNIDCNVSTGTIFAVYERISPPNTLPTYVFWGV